MLALLCSSTEAGEATLRRLCPELGTWVRNYLPPPDVDVERRRIAAMKIIVEGLGAEHGGREWLVSVKDRLWTDDRSPFDHPEKNTTC